MMDYGAQLNMYDWQAALGLSAEQQEALIANTASMLAHFTTACQVHRTLLQSLMRLPMTASGCRQQRAMVRRCAFQPKPLTCAAEAARL